MLLLRLSLLRSKRYGKHNTSPELKAETTGAALLFSTKEVAKTPVTRKVNGYSKGTVEQ